VKDLRGSRRRGTAGLPVAIPPPVNPAPHLDVPSPAPTFQDGLGERARTTDRASSDALEILRLRPDLTAVASFEFALRERTARLANFRHAYYARIRRIDRTADGGLAVVSDAVEGARLSDILRVAERQCLTLDINAALCLIRQLVPAVALLHENARDVAHGALAPERLIVTPHARLVIVEHVMGSAIEQLQFGRERLWTEFRVAMPPCAGLPRCDQRADVAQIGVIALSLVLGRLLRPDEFPSKIADLLRDATEMSVLGDRQLLSPPLRQWLARALQLDVRSGFQTARDAQVALEEVLSDESGYVAAPVGLETFLTRYQSLSSAAAAAPPAVAPRVNVPPPAVDLAAPAPVASSLAAEVSVDPVASDHADAAAVVAPEVFEEPVAAQGEFDLPPASAELELFGPEMLETVEEESLQPQPVARPARHRSRVLRPVIAVLAMAALAEGAILTARTYLRPAAPVAEMGVLVVESQPAGVEIFIDGLARGVTPARLSLPAGAHILELRGRGVPRVIPLRIGAGSQLSQYIELPDTPPIGQLQVSSMPPGARVIVDGEPRGVTPLTIPDLPVGPHKVVVQGENGAIEQVVAVEPGATASILAPLAPAAGPASGWIALSAPVEMQVFEDGRLLGTTRTDRIMVAAGRHRLDLVSEALGFRATRVVQVPPGRVTPLAIELPRAPVSINAQPWAEVWIDNERVGETPLANVQVPIGPHEIVFRHPELGEKRHAVTITLGAPARVTIDMRK